MLSFKWKIAGYALLLMGAVMAILFFLTDFRFEFPIFAIFSSYMETRFFTFFSTNFADELIMMVLLCGFAFVSFSKEKKESDHLKTARMNAIRKTAIVNTVFLIFSILFVYGSGFIAVLIVNMFMPFIIYLILFNTIKNKIRQIRI
jgi:amino acid transporter